VPAPGSRTGASAYGAGRAGDHLAGPGGGQGVAGRGRPAHPGLRQEPALEISHGQVEVEVGVQLLDPPGQRVTVAELLAGHAGRVAGHPLAHLPEAATASDQREHQTRRRSHDEQDGQRLEVDAGVQPHRDDTGRTSA
jgi:hypothetical protein